jgi:outer membrane lipoprotein-sorting protein
MKNGIAASLMALALCLPPSLSAKPAEVPRHTAQEVFDKMVDAEDRREALIADITRTERRKIGEGQGKTNTVKGNLVVRKGGYARLNITEPAPQRLVTNGKVLFMELPEVEQVYKLSTSKMKESGNFFLDLGGTIRFYAENSLKRLIPPGGKFDTKVVMAIELIPKDAETSGFDAMRVWVDTGRWVILRAVLESKTADVGVSFDKIQTFGLKSAKDKGYELKLDKRYFRYSPPDNFEVFDLDF